MGKDKIKKENQITSSNSSIAKICIWMIFIETYAYIFFYGVFPEVRNRKLNKA
jgi:hypothetical protein